MIVTLLAAMLDAASPATPPPPRCERDLCVVETDLTPRFLAFRTAVRETPAAATDPDLRFVLWKRHYAFAAVPPGPTGEAMARRLIDAAWSRYDAVEPMLRRPVRERATDPLATLGRVATLLGRQGPLTIKVTRFVGGFEDNAFTAATPAGMPVVYLPVESSDVPLLQSHEIAHAVHIATAHLPGGWERSIAQTALMEGIAMHATRLLIPGRPTEDYISAAPGWWPAVLARKTAILAGVRGALAKRDGESVGRFTVGTGTTGQTREAYAAGWWIVEEMLVEGRTMAEIAAIPEPEMVREAEQAIDRLLAG